MSWWPFPNPFRRTPETTPYERLVDELLLPPEIRRLLDPSLTEIGAPIEESTFADAAGRQVRYHRVATAARTHVALIHVPKAILESHLDVIQDLGTTMTAVTPPIVTGLFVFSSAIQTDGSLDTAAAYLRTRGLTDVAWFTQRRLDELAHVTDAADRKALVRAWLNLPKPQLPAAPLSPPPATIDPEHIETLANAWARHADSQLIGVLPYFRSILARTELVDVARSRLLAGLTDAASVNAHHLIRLALVEGGGINQADPNYTVLGSLLATALPTFDPAAAAVAVALISGYELYRHPELLATIRQRYLLPVEPVEREMRSPHIQWEETPVEKELQSALSKRSSLLDVGALIGMYERAGSVCYISVPDIDSYGTGFLIAPDLVLTNIHVFLPRPRPAPDQQEAVARGNVTGATLRFRYTTATEGEARDGRTFAIASPSALVRASPVEKYDYALLRVTEARGVKGIGPAPCVTNVPELKSALHILQHAPETALRLGFQPSGVTSVNESLALVQYITSAEPGSSGAPCFDKNWKVVALHHAEQKSVIPDWSRREGILLRPILSELKDLLEEKSA